MPDGERSSQNMLEKIKYFFNFKNKKQPAKDYEQVIDEIDDWKHYKHLKAEDIMIPRIDIVAIDYKSSIDEICKVFLKTRHTRMPVYKDELDKIIGFINIKDVFPYLCEEQNKKEFNINNIIRKLLVISPSMKIFDLLDEMKKTRTHIALVIDEFGGSDGLITIEDLVEEIIGKIEDEHDIQQVEVKEIKPNIFEATGRTEISILEEKFGFDFSDKEKEDYDTISGLVLSISGHVPGKGEKIKHPSSGLIFEITDSDKRRIKKLLIRKSQQEILN